MSDSPAPLPPQPASNQGSATLFVILGIAAFGAFLCAGGLVALLVPAIMAARSAAEEAKHKNDLRQLGIACYVFAEQDPRRAFPNSLSDIGSLTPDVINALRERKIELIEDLTMPQFEASRIPASEIVLARPVDPSLASTEVVSALMCDGSVQTMSMADVLTKIEAWERELKKSGESKSEFE